MNINLGTHVGDEDANDGPNVQSDIEEHQQIMQHAGYNILGPAILVPDPDPGYPGAYQVWNPIDADGELGWVWIDPDGVAVLIPELPTAEDMGLRS